MAQEFVETAMKTLLLDPADTVKVVLSADGPGLTPGSKVAREAILKGSPIVKLGATIGFATQDIAEGAHVNHCVMKEFGEPKIARHDSNHVKLPELPAHLTHFDGYLNADGSVGTRNYLCIVTSVQCVSGIAEHAVERIRSEFLPHYPNVDGIVLINHSYGCGVAIDAREAHIPRRTLSNLTLNPNFGRYALLLGLGCEKLRHEMMLASLSDPPNSLRLQYDSLYIQSVQGKGFNAILEAICEKSIKALELLNSRRRQRLPISNIIVGMQCGGSDAFSGISANPVLGRMSDMIVAAGGSAIFSENTECMDAEDYLMNRCVTEEVALALKREFDWYRNYLAQGGADRTANTTPGNKAGGLSSISEKALGSIAKAGTTPIVDVISSGERLQRTGLNFLSGPASDFICGTLQLAAGANMHVFTTGRGTPYSIDGFPVLKVSSNTTLYEKWFDLMDFDAGRVFLDKSLDESAVDLLDLIVKTASGAETAAERLGIRNSHVLFNPAPVT